MFPAKHGHIRSTTFGYFKLASEYGDLCRAIGHAGATVHVESHALGLPIYELTAIVLKYGKDNFATPVSKKINYYYNRLLY